MTLNHDDLVKRVMSLTGIAEPKLAEVVLEATLEALGERLSSGDAAILADALPPDLSAALLRLRRHTAPSLSALYARVSVCEGVCPGSAVEHAQAVARALAEALGFEERLLLQRRLPPDWAALFSDDVRSTTGDAPSSANIAGERA